MWCRRRHFSHSFRYCTKCLKQLLGALACPVERNFYRKCHSLDYRKLKRQLERSDASPLLIIDKHTKPHSSGVWNRSCPVLYHFQRKLLWFLCFIYFCLFVLFYCHAPSPPKTGLSGVPGAVPIISKLSCTAAKKPAKEASSPATAKVA